MDLRGALSTANLKVELWLVHEQALPKEKQVPSFAAGSAIPEVLWKGNLLSWT